MLSNLVFSGEVS